MEHGPFRDDFPIKTSIDKGFSMAMLNNQRVIRINLNMLHISNLWIIYLYLPIENDDKNDSQNCELVAILQHSSAFDDSTIIIGLKLRELGYFITHKMQDFSQLRSY